MKQFNKDGKYNFVDNKNRLVGYDSGQSCCENANWFLHNKVDDIEQTFIGDTEGYNFDPKFFQDHPKKHGNRYLDIPTGLSVDSGGAVTFRLVKGRKQLFLTLYNCHNGYYGHGFEFKDADTILQQGVL